LPKSDKFSQVHSLPTWDLQNSQHEEKGNHESNNAD